MKKYVLFAAAVALISASAFAQAPRYDIGEADTTAIIVADISVNYVQGLHFGAVYSPSSAVTAKVFPDGTNNYDSGSGAPEEAPSSPGTQAAQFTITTEPGADIVITAPSNYNVLIGGYGNGGASLAVSTFVLEDGSGTPITTGSTITNTTGELEVNIGASLAIGSGALPGTYENDGAGGTGLKLRVDLD